MTTTDWTGPQRDGSVVVAATDLLDVVHLLPPDVEMRALSLLRHLPRELGWLLRLDPGDGPLQCNHRDMVVIEEAIWDFKENRRRRQRELSSQG